LDQLQLKIKPPTSFLSVNNERLRKVVLRPFAEVALSKLDVLPRCPFVKMLFNFATQSAS
jgi:hypothetical protein